MEKTAVIECLRLASDGSGVGYLNGLATFVPGLLPGETGEIEVCQRKSRYQKARLIKALTLSQARRDPPCSVYEACGGCRLQHLDYAGALAWKQQWVADALQRIGKINVQVNPVLGMDFPWRYRNKTRLHRDEAETLGYHREKSNNTVVFKDCLLLSEPMNEWIRAVNPLFRESFSSINNIVFRQTSDNEGLILLEGMPDAKEMLLLKRELERVHSSFSARNPKEAQELKAIEEREAIEERKAIEGLKAIKVSEEKETHALEKIRRQGLEKIQAVWGLDFSGLPVRIWGEKEMEVSLQGLDFRVSPLAFLQINPAMTEKLYALVLNWAELAGKELVWDLYSGIGSLTLALARKAGRVIGIEENPFATEDARRNSLANHVENVEFLTGKVEDLLPGLTEDSPGQPVLVVLDPPRTGVRPEVTDALLKVKPEKIIYVSCAPGTLARDAGRLVQGGYRVKQVQPVDMFPWTEHVETVIMMERL